MDRALETARKAFIMAHGWQWCERSEREWNSLPAMQREQLASIAALIQSAMNAQEREPIQLLREIINSSAWTHIPINLYQWAERLLAERGEGR